MSTFHPKGTYDLLPPDSARYLAVREALAAPLRGSGYGYVETPGFENVELFARGVGASTDIVTKERREGAEGRDKGPVGSASLRSPDDAWASVCGTMSVLARPLRHQTDTT